MAGSHVYRYPWDTGINLDDVLSPSTNPICCFHASWFNHIYHLAILITSKSAVLSYNYDRREDPLTSLDVTYACHAQVVGMPFPGSFPLDQAAIFSGL